MIRFFLFLVVLVFGLTSCPQVITSRYIASLTPSPEAQNKLAYLPQGELVGQINASNDFIVNGTYSDLVNQTGKSSTGDITAVTLTSPSGVTCALTWNKQIVPSSSAFPYISFSGTISGTCTTSGDSTQWLEWLNSQQINVKVTSANFPNGLMTGVFKK